MRLRTFSSLFLFCGLAIGCWADQIYLTNGDRLTGSILKMESGRLIVKTEFAGQIDLDWNRVSGIVSDQLLVVDRKGLTELRVRNVERIGGRLAVHSMTESYTLDVDNVAAIRSEDQFRVHERTLHPEWSENWNVTASSGVALARGNSETTNLNLGLDSVRKTLHDKVTLQASAIYATDDRLGLPTANALRGQGRYDFDVSRNLFVYGTGSMETDDLQGLSLRSLVGGGFGHHALRTVRHTLDVLGGMAYTREGFDTGLTRHFTTGSFGSDYQWRMTPQTHMTQRLEFDTYLNDPGNYRAAFHVGLSTKFTRLFTWHTKLSNRYNNSPLQGKRRNDILMTTGLGLTFSSRIE